MPDGNTMWNGKYGEQEKARREQYPRQDKYKLEQMIKAGEKKESSPWDEKILHLDK